MTRWDAFVAVCAYIRAGFLGGELPITREDTRWELLISVSSQHFVTPAMAWCLRDVASVPSDIRAYFDAAANLNARRNDRFLAALTDVVSALNIRGIEPVLLKGAARLVDGIYPARSLRFMGDLDLLIPLREMEDAVAALGEIGFEAEVDDGIDPCDHHLPMLRDSKSGVGVELHRSLNTSSFEDVVPTTWFLKRTRPFRFSNLQVRLPDPTAAVAHNIVHDQLANYQYLKHRAELRQLLDFALIKARYGDEIDWIEIDRLFSGANMGRILASYRELENRLLTPHAFDDDCGPQPISVASFLRRGSSWQVIRLLAMEYASARHKDPLGVVRLFSISRWFHRIRLIKSGFDSAV